MAAVLHGLRSPTRSTRGYTPMSLRDSKAGEVRNAVPSELRVW